MVASKKLSPMDRLASSVEVSKGLKVHLNTELETEMEIEIDVDIDVDVYIDSDSDSDVAIDMFKTV